MSFNVRFGTADDGPFSWPSRRDSAIKVVRSELPDILGVQEALDFQLAEFTEAAPSYRVVGVGREDGFREGEFAAILFDSTRYDVQESGTFWLSETPDRVSTSWDAACTRICTWADFGEFRVFNCHLDHASEPARFNAAELIISRMGDDKPAILMGDFNEGEAGRVAPRLRSSGLTDTFRVVHRTYPEPATFHGFLLRAPIAEPECGEKIDAIYVTHHFEVLGAGLVLNSPYGIFPSDHFPVTATVRLPKVERP